MTLNCLSSILSTLVLLAACGGAGAEPGGATGGASAAAGGATVGSGGASGGVTSTGGSAPVIAGAGAGSVTGCPAWPHSKLMPLVGVFFFGPDPGPCSSEDAVESPTSEVLDAYTYNYDSNGRLLSTHSEQFNVDTTCSWNGDVLVSCTIGKVEGQEAVVQSYTADAASLIATSSTSAGTRVETYMLSTNGYPLQVVRTNDSGAVLSGAEYAYSDCRLVRKTMTNGISSVPLSGGTTTYAYDELGHVKSRSSDDGVTTTYDYACWRN